MLTDYVYECDPDKNTECNKTGCMYEKSSVYPVCHQTMHEEYAWDGKKTRKVKNRSKGVILEEN